MSDYTRLTFFRPKDALSSGDPSKVIYGAELDPEFSSISTAIATKYDDSDLASQAQAEAGILNTVIMTPLRSREHIDSYLTAGPVSPGVDITSGVISFDFDAIDTGAAIDASNDLMMYYDASTGENAKTTVTALVTAGAADFAQKDVELTTSGGLAGGGDLSADRTFTLDPTNDRNVDHSSVTITAGDGLAGGGDITASRTLDLDLSTLITAALPNDLSDATFAFDQAGVPRSATVQSLVDAMATGGAGEAQTVTLISQSDFESTTSVGDDDVLTKGNFAGTASNKGSIKLPGGLLLNWGSKTVGPSTSATDTFDTPYSGTPWLLTASQDDVQGQSDGAVGAGTNNNSSLRLKNGYTGSQKINWFAIGPA